MPCKKNRRTLAVYGSGAAAGAACGISVACAVGVGALGGIAKYVESQRAKNRKITRLGMLNAAVEGAGSRGAKATVKKKYRREIDRTKGHVAKRAKRYWSGLRGRAGVGTQLPK